MLDRTPTFLLNTDNSSSLSQPTSAARDETLLDSYSHAVTSVVTRIGPAVVRVEPQVSGKTAGMGSGVIISPDDLYAFVTVEGVGNEPGTVEIIDLKALKTVATVDIARQAAGIDFYRTDVVK